MYVGYVSHGVWNQLLVSFILFVDIDGVVHWFNRNVLKLKMKRNSWKRKRNDMVEIHSHISGS